MMAPRNLDLSQRLSLSFPYLQQTAKVARQAAVSSETSLLVLHYVALVPT